jgi:hypothetical protein
MVRSVTVRILACPSSAKSLELLGKNQTGRQLNEGRSKKYGPIALDSNRTELTCGMLNARFEAFESWARRWGVRCRV